MNYEPIVIGTQSNGFADPKSSHDDGSKPLSDDRNKVDEDPKKENDYNDHEKEVNVNSTNNVNTVSSTVNTAGTNEVNVVGENISIGLQFDQNMPTLDDVSTFGVVDDMNNLDTTFQKEPKRVIHALKDPSWIEAMQKEIKEEVYVCQPPTFEDPYFPDRVYKVKEALYGLHQAPKAWQKKDGIFISQDKYVAEIIKKFKFTEVKTASTPMETQKPLLNDEDDEEVDVHMYRSMIGSLMYLTSLRPDIKFVVCAYARYQVNPKVSHLHAMKMIF
nr:hypothetical protein [Tanacetum cinerariifolium]